MLSCFSFALKLGIRSTDAEDPEDNARSDLFFRTRGACLKDDKVVNSCVGNTGVLPNILRPFPMVYVFWNLQDYKKL